MIFKQLLIHDKVEQIFNTPFSFVNFTSLSSLKILIKDLFAMTF